MEHSVSPAPGAERAAAWCLDVHAGYGCRDTGACCTAGWDIPIESPAYERVRVHFGARARRERPFVTGRTLPEGATAIVGVQANGACTFYDEDRARHCTIHGELGAGSLPVACRQFPRIVLQDARGLLISLSHFCPTAAACLTPPSPLAIVAAPPNLAQPGLEGLDARGALPPLLHPTMLTDIAGYAAWERRALGVLARGDVTAPRALAIVAAATTVVQAWRPGGAPLHDAVEEAFDQELALARGGDDREDPDADARRFALAAAAVPDGLTRPQPVTEFVEAWPRVRDRLADPDADAIVRSYLAARLFGNWMAYYGQGLHAIVEYLRVAQAVLRMEAARYDRAAAAPWQTITTAIRHTDLLLVHLADLTVLARRLS